MERDYQAIHAFDLAPVAATVQKAETDWPEKKADLDSRLAAVRGAAAQSDSLWQSTDAARRQAAAGNYAGLDFAALLAAADSLKTSAATLPQKTAELQLAQRPVVRLVGQAAGGYGGSRHRQCARIRPENPHGADAPHRRLAAKTGATTSEEKWVGVPQTTYEAMRNDLGMAIEHKPAGQYDSESEHVAQPAGFAYMAPPTQASNQYGYWEHRDGRNFWVFYGQYALMRDLLFNHGYQPVERGEWEGYRTYQSRGQTYYGQDARRQRAQVRLAGHGHAEPLLGEHLCARRRLPRFEIRQQAGIVSRLEVRLTGGARSQCRPQPEAVRKREP